jgi:hypothetical protein
VKRRPFDRVAALAGALRRDPSTPTSRARRQSKRTVLRLYDERWLARTVDIDEEPGRSIAEAAGRMLDAAGR